QPIASERALRKQVIRGNRAWRVTPGPGNRDAREGRTRTARGFDQIVDRRPKYERAVREALREAPSDLEERKRWRRLVAGLLLLGLDPPQNEHKSTALQTDQQVGPRMPRSAA